LESGQERDEKVEARSK